MFLVVFYLAKPQQIHPSLCNYSAMGTLLAPKTRSIEFGARTTLLLIPAIDFKIIEHTSAESIEVNAAVKTPLAG